MSATLQTIKGVSPEQVFPNDLRAVVFCVGKNIGRAIQLYVKPSDAILATLGSVVLNEEGARQLKEQLEAFLNHDYIKFEE